MSSTPDLPVVLVAIRRDRSLMRALGPIGYVVIESPSGGRALERARETRPDVIILDTELSDLTGLEACRLFRGEPHIGRNVPILMLTSGPPTPEQRVTALRAGVWDFLPYGADGHEMSLKLETYIQAKRNIDATLAEGLFDPTTGLHSRPGLARRARELGALMARHHGALACVVFAVDGPPDPRAGNLVAQTARVCDVVGSLGPGEFAVLAPGTTDAGVLKLAQRVVSVLCAPPGGGTNPATPGPTLRVGYDVGQASAEEVRVAARSTPPGLVLEDHGKGKA